MRRHLHGQRLGALSPESLLVRRHFHGRRLDALSPESLLVRRHFHGRRRHALSPWQGTCCVTENTTDRAESQSSLTNRTLFLR